MKSLLMKSVYAGLGLLGSGKETVEELGRKLAKRADLSEQDGRKIARHLQERSKQAMAALEKTLENEAMKVVKALHAASKELAGPGARKPAARRARPKNKASA